MVVAHLPTNLDRDAGKYRAVHNAALRQLDAFKKQLEEGRMALICEAAGSALWRLRKLDEVLGIVEVHVVEFGVQEGRRWHWYRIAHNLPKESFNVFGTTVFEANGETGRESWGRTLARCLTLRIKGGLAKWGARQFPVGREEQQAWVLEGLMHSTRGFAKPGVAAKICDEVETLLATMEVGKEELRLKYVLKFGDFRGSEVSLRDGAVCEGGRQVIPYPAIAWDWKCVQSYAWQSSQHINILELVAFFNYLRACVNKADNHCCRFLHVLDSRVASCVLAKGRSSSSKLNRILRRVGSLLLASDLYVLPMWTISGWNFSDHGSRAVRPELT